MNYDVALAKLIQDGVDSLWRSVKAMPDEKLDWRPAPEARTTRELLEELAMTTGFSTELVRTQTVPDMSHGGGEKVPKSLADLEKEHRDNLVGFVEAMKAFPESKLEEMIELPWGKMDFLQVIAYPYWNLMYHWGQINYLQTMYGDKAMH